METAFCGLIVPSNNDFSHSSDALNFLKTIAITNKFFEDVKLRYFISGLFYTSVPFATFEK